MASEENSSYNNLSPFDNRTKQLYLIQFWLFLVLIIPSIIFTLVALYYLLLDRTLRQALNNHAIILILSINLFCEITDIPFYIHYFHSFESFTGLSSFRLIWGYLDWTLFLIFLCYMLGLQSKDIFLSFIINSSIREENVFFFTIFPHL
jgi:hypothetical protein